MFTLDQVVPWGRSLEEYRRMFALSDRDLMRPVVGCGDGPASFNAEGSELAASIVSVDPLYQWNASQIRERIAVTRTRIVDQTRAHADQFVWTRFHTVDDLVSVRMTAMDRFLQHYGGQARAGRYVAGALPTLPFRNDAFELALCSHFLFLYTDQNDQMFHRRAIAEMCRVAPEARIFPLLALNGRRSPHLDSCAGALRGAGYTVAIETVDYEFQRGGNEMMRVRRTL